MHPIPTEVTFSPVLPRFVAELGRESRHSPQKRRCPRAIARRDSRFPGWNPHRRQEGSNRQKENRGETFLTSKVGPHSHPVFHMTRILSHKEM